MAKRKRIKKTADTPPKRYQPWTKEEEEFIMTSELTDVEIAKVIGRTLGSIYNKRFQIREREERHGGNE